MTTNQVRNQAATTTTGVRRAVLACGGATAVMLAGAAGAAADTEVDPPAEFTSAFTTTATPDNVINADGDPTPGEEGGMGTFTFMINSELEIICYDIELTGITPPYQSPARTATHIHEAEAGSAGPPRLAFPNPTPDDSDSPLTSSGCMQGPFTTGLEDDNGDDTATGFSLAQIEEDPAAFFADTHTEEFPAGAIRGQLQQIPVGGVETGFGPQAAESGAVSPLLVGVGAAGLGALAFAGAAVVRHQRG